MLLALTRPISDSLASCELTHLTRHPIDLPRARAQHHEYEQALEALGVHIIPIAPAHDLPDAVFVEDTAVVLDEVAVITRPGAASRRPETVAVAAALARHRPLFEMTDPATLDGGDVLRVGRTIYVGRSSRTNAAGIDQLAALISPWNYALVPVNVSNFLHLKSAATLVGHNSAGPIVLINPQWIPAATFAGASNFEVDPAEPYAANGLLVGSSLIYPIHFPKTRARLEAAGIHVVPIPCDELAKAEGAVTCCSILLQSQNTLK